MARHAKESLPVEEKIFGLAWQHGVHVVIEVKKLFVQSLNAVQVHLYGIAIECRQIFRGDDVPV